jgi:tetratricopeptide (TPR) repeat protein
MAVDENEKAKKYLDSAHEVARRLRSRRMAFNIQAQLCDYYLKVRDYGQYKDTMKQLRTTVKASLTAPQEGVLDLLSGRCYLQTGKASKARALFRRSLKIFQDLGEQLNAGKVYYYRAILEQGKGDAQKAQKHITKAIKIFELNGACAWRDKARTVLESL